MTAILIAFIAGGALGFIGMALLAANRRADEVSEAYEQGIEYGMMKIKMDWIAEDAERGEGNG